MKNYRGSSAKDAVIQRQGVIPTKGVYACVEESLDINSYRMKMCK